MRSTSLLMVAAAAFLPEVLAAKGKTLTSWDWYVCSNTDINE
jgi:hypothetical protein